MRSTLSASQGEGRQDLVRSSESMSSYVYILENLSDDSACYVGKANDPTTRFKQHCGLCRGKRKSHIASYLYSAMRKYGIDCWNVHVVEGFENEREAYKGEREWISYLKSMNVRLYNITQGGYGGVISGDANLKRSETLKGRVPWNVGKTASEETKKRMGDSHRGLKMPPRTEEWKQKQSVSQIKELRRCSVCNKAGHDKRKCKEKSS